MITYDDVLPKVCGVVSEALKLDENGITPTSRLVKDLDAESIDLLDVVFRLEREFSIKIPRGELFPEPIYEADLEHVQDGCLTVQGLALLRQQLPFADMTEFEKDPQITNISDLYTVQMLCLYVVHRLISTPNP